VNREPSSRTPTWSASCTAPNTIEDNRFDGGGYGGGHSGGGNGGYGGGGDYGGGGNKGGGAPNTPKDNPHAGIRRDPSEFGGSKVFITPGGFQTMQSKANNMSWDDDDLPGGGGALPLKPTPPDEDAPF
jgi:hypothetical protein